MPFIYIDRRKAGKGKSSGNRQKLLRRVRSFVKSSLPQNIGAGGVTGQNAKSMSPVRVAGDALEEPFFAYSKDGDHIAILIGNSEYDRGDEIELPDDEDGSGNGAGNGENGEDEFSVNVARDEFLDLFFEDCELPNLQNEKFTDKLDNKFQQAGFSTTGSPAQLSIIRSYKQMVGRRRALASPYYREMDELEVTLAELQAGGTSSGSSLDGQIMDRISAIHERMDVLRRKIGAVEGFDKVDLRYRKREAHPLKTVDAVLVMIMDISGSMDEEKKKIARRWFALLYAFIRRRYPNCELVFLAHTTEPFEMSEQDFFSTRINGGTMVSPTLAHLNGIIKQRYDPNQTNIYVCHASDGDNWSDDNPGVKKEMVGEGNLCGKIQFFSYVEVGKPYSVSYNTVSKRSDTNLWEAYDGCREKASSKKINLSIVVTADDCYPVFKKLFRKSK